MTTVVEVLQDSHMSSEAFVFQTSMEVNRSICRSRKSWISDILLPLS